MRRAAFFLFVLLPLSYLGFAEAPPTQNTDGASWCNTISFQDTFVVISRGRTETFLVKVVCPEALDPKRLSFPEGMSAKAEVVGGGLRITLAVPFEKKSRMFGSESIFYEFPDGEKRRIVTVKVRRSDADSTSIDFTK